VPEPAPLPEPAPEPVPAPEPAPAPAPAPAAAPPAVPAPEEVVVAGTALSHTAGAVQVIRKEQLERHEYDDPSAILLQVPGVFYRGEDGIGLRPNIGIRGSNPDRSKKLTLMEDGILFGPAPYSAPAAYYFPLMTRMTQVRVIKGPAAIGYGPQTVGGAIDFISRPVPTRTTGALDVAAGQYGYEKAHAYFGSSDGNVGVLVEGVRLQNTGFTELPNGADTGSTRNDWMVKVAYTIDPDAKIKNAFQVKLSYADEKSNETYLGQSDADFPSASPTPTSARIRIDATPRARSTR
jgi:Fe(3+) dicitrate transport protein